jgi:hypothetical protein
LSHADDSNNRGLWKSTLKRGAARIVSWPGGAGDELAPPPPAPEWTRPTPLLPPCTTCGSPVLPCDPDSRWSAHAATCGDCWAAIRPAVPTASFRPPPPPDPPGGWHPLPDFPGYAGSAEGRCRGRRGELAGFAAVGAARKYTLRDAAGRVRSLSPRRVAALVSPNLKEG